LSIAVDKFEFAGAKFIGGGWEGLATWYDKVTDDRYNKPLDSDDKTGFEAIGLRDRVRQVYDRTRGEYRYVSISVGVGGWRPRKASEVAKSRYGDCKDLATLLVSQLRSIGIDAAPALILTRDKGYLDVDFLTTGFNHVIAAAFVGSDTLWMDPTCSHCPLGVLPWTDQYTNALIVRESQSGLVNTPKSTADDNSRIRRSRLTLGSDMHLRIQADIELSGYPAVRLRGQIPHLSRAEKRELAANMFKGGTAIWQIETCGFQNEEDDSKPLMLNIEGQAKKPVRVLKNAAYINACVLYVDAGYADEDLSSRTRPIRLQYPWMIVDSVWFEIDSTSAYDSIRIFDDHSDASSFAYSTVTSLTDSGTVLVVSDLTFFEHEIRAEEFGRLREFENTLSNRSRSLIKVFLKN